MSVFSFTSPIRRVSQVPAAIQGETAWLRPLGPDEADPLHAVFDAMSPESRYARYLQAVPELTPSMTRTLTAVDGTDHVAWLASIGDRPVGIGRYFKVGPCSAEIAFEVADEFHGLGLGAALLDTVTTVAAVSGIRELQALVLGSNHRSQRLLSLVGLELAPQGGGVLEADGPFHLLEQPRVERPMVVRLALVAPQPVAA
ncbi:GNAT family N-acetyltransferase [Nocardioides sp.]|uniref:GNAT family N-acetyltransferase n=1 Tax=Nocardioides sp. TaxID=35761 RepID=UPI002ED2D000